MSVEWTPDLAVGYDKIDQQHAELIRRFNRLEEACLAQSGRDEVLELLDFLDHYVMEHFTEEERLMLNARYPQIMDHQQEHLELITKLRKFKRQMHEFDLSPGLVAEVSRTMFQWIVDHILQTDAKLGAYLNAQKSSRT